jgi:hypothetical protein
MFSKSPCKFQHKRMSRTSKDLEEIMTPVIPGRGSSSSELSHSLVVQLYIRISIRSKVK